MAEALIENIAEKEVNQFIADAAWLEKNKARIARIEAFKERFKKSEEGRIETDEGIVWKEFGSVRATVDQSKLKTRYAAVYKACLREVTPVSVKWSEK